eukprot:gene2987-3444_t
MDPYHGMPLEENPFYDSVRECIISLLVFIGLYFTSYGIIVYLKKRRQKHLDDEDDFVNRIALWLCCFTMSVSIGAVLLLPFSIISNEILLRYPSSFYVKWLNDSLIHGLWNQIFLGTYLSLFLAMPFAYFFTESVGFAGSAKGIKARVFETLVVLSLLGVLTVSLVWVIYGILHSEGHKSIGSWMPHLPFMYSCISLFGVMLQLVCAPLGFARLFSVLGHYVVKPQFLRDLDDELKAIQLQEEAMKRRMKNTSKKTFQPLQTAGATENNLFEKVLQLQEDKKTLERQREASAWERNLLYPICLLALLALTALCLCKVALNCLSLLFLNENLPLKTRYSTLGKMSFSFLGSFGSLIANCIMLLVLSSALPILSRTLGVTKFDLMGEFGKLDWLGNFYLVLGYNLIFEASTSLCLANKFTATVRQALFDKMRQSSAVKSLLALKLK